MLSDIRTLTSYDVVLTPTNAEAAELNRELALTGGVLSCLVCSHATWTERLWELAGNGRLFVDGLTRIVAMAVALEGRDGLSGPHLPSLLAQRMRDAAGTPRLDAALADVRVGASPEGLLPAEVEVLRALAAYEDELGTLGLIEEGSALAYLANHLNEAFPQFLRVGVVGEAPLDPRFEALLDAAAAAGCIELAFLGHLPEKAGAELERAPKTTKLRFAFPSGRYATPQLVLKVVDELAGEGPIVISSRKPAELYRLLEPALAARGLKTAMRGSVPLVQTTLGSLVLSLSRTLAGVEPPWDKGSLTDALANPIVHVGARTRTRFDARLRENRLLNGLDALEAMPGIERVAELMMFVHEPSFETLVKARAAVAKQVILPFSARSEAHAVLDAFAAIIKIHEALGQPVKDLGYLLTAPLGQTGLVLRWANAELAPGERADVLIESMSQAAVEPFAGFATALVLDLDAESYPAARKDGAIDLLMARLGVPAPETPIARQRRQLAALTVLPTKTLILGRCLTNAKSEPTYPAAVLEEFVDLYREDVTLADDIDNLYALPEELQQGLITCGEDALEADVWPGMEAAGERAVKEPPKASLLISDDVETQPVLRLSPAQIEAYLDCPRKWLYSRRLGVGGLDEEMGSRELGIFRHDSLQRFYELFRKEGQAKVCAENLDLAKEILKRAMAEVMKEYLALDDDGRPVRLLDRCVAPRASSEARSIWHVRDELLEWLSFEAAFLPGTATGEGMSPFMYVPRAFELSLNDFDVTFAGAKLIGRIDRVDVALDGSNFVVVDYKGHVGTNYSPVLKDGELVLPTKVQALIYAAAIARTPALREALGITRTGIEAIAGAVYVSYLRGHAIRGTFGEHLSRERHLPTLPSKAEPLTTEGMAAFIDEIERVVATKVVAPILAGNTDPLPLAGACTFCPAQACPGRGWSDAS